MRCSETEDGCWRKEFLTVAVVRELHCTVSAMLSPQSRNALRPLENNCKTNGSLALNGERLFQTQDTDSWEGRMRNGEREMGSNDEQRICE